MDPNTQFSCIYNHFDLISAINHKLQAFPIQWFWIHVKGHKDYHLGPIDRFTTLNVTFDMADKHRWEIDQKNRLSMHQQRFLQG